MMLQKNFNFKKYPVWAEINLKALEHNFNLVKNKVNKSEIIPIIKANAYGHGIKELAEFFVNKLKVKKLGIARVNEGVLLRESDIKSVSLIILGGFVNEEIDYIIKYNLEPSVFSKKEIINLGKKADKYNKIINVHLKINTGMNRLGIKPDEALFFIKLIQKFKNLKIKSVYSHLANADMKKDDFSMRQFKSLINLKNEIKDTVFHLANSAAILKYPFTYLDAVRPGIILYGSFMDKKMKKNFGLKPVMTLKSKVLNIINLNKGDRVSYGGSYMAKGKERIGIIGIGYGDGFRRQLSNDWYVLIKGKKSKIVGRVCMDLTAIKVSSDVKTGDEVLIFGRDKYGEIAVEDMALKLKTISYEIFTGISERVPRIFIY